MHGGRPKQGALFFRKPFRFFAEGFYAKIQLGRFAGFAQPLPRSGERVSVNRVRIRFQVLALGLVFANDNHAPCYYGAASAVQASEALPQRIQARALADQTIEINVSTHL
jgi:hypothetical protein